MPSDTAPQARLTTAASFLPQFFLENLVIRRDNSMLIHTFTYSEKAQDKMNYIVENGGYQVGDQVSIRWIPGGSEALDIKGRPSKP